MLSIVLSNHWLSVHSFVHYYLPQRSTHTGARTHTTTEYIQPYNHPPPTVHLHTHTYSAMSQAGDNTTPRALREVPQTTPRVNANAQQSFFTPKKGAGLLAHRHAALAAAAAAAASPATPALGQQVCVVHTLDRPRESEREREVETREGGREEYKHASYICREKQREKQGRAREREKEEKDNHASQPSRRTQIFTDLCRLPRVLRLKI